jgi:hypothetical protein
MDHRKSPEHIRALKQEIDDLGRLNELYWHGNLPSDLANLQHERRRERLKEIRDELRSLAKLRTGLIA